MRTIIMSLLLVLAGTASAAESPAPASKWHITNVGGATSDGQIQFLVTPHEGEAVTVTVKVNHGRPETFITKDVVEAFKAQLPKKRFKSEVISQKTLVKAGPGEADFSVALVESTAAGVRVYVTAN
jgi:hypothetical protein